MSVSWLHPHFTAAGAVVGVAAAAYVIAVAPLLGRWKYQRLARARSHDAGALTRFYRLSLIIGWGWVVVVLGVPALSPLVKPGDLGLAWPSGSGAGVAIGATVALLVLFGLTAIAIRRYVASGRPLPGQGRFAALVPETSAERRLAGAVTVTAGISEELLCRGLLIATGVGVFRLPVLVAAALAVLLFGLAHLYQGATGVLGTAIVGAVLTALYLASGSLLLPILVHIALDARSLLLARVPPALPAPAAPAPAADP
ncbi:MAG TPA: CPBP family intramembrane glutamic endopeptidase [Actinomycetota bacterium]|nr:CPBP family intramembrane glutamic endopeptidase [Actinomycetota bacterium]